MRICHYLMLTFVRFFSSYRRWQILYYLLSTLFKIQIIVQLKKLFEPLIQPIFKSSLNNLKKSIDACYAATEYFCLHALLQGGRKLCQIGLNVAEKLWWWPKFGRN